jgi:hypothetical protein
MQREYHEKCCVSAVHGLPAAFHDDFFTKAIGLPPIL